MASSAALPVDAAVILVEDQRIAVHAGNDKIVASTSS
jgi:hypothetical protein